MRDKRNLNFFCKKNDGALKDQSPKYPIHYFSKILLSKKVIVYLAGTNFISLKSNIAPFSDFEFDFNTNF